MSMDLDKLVTTKAHRDLFSHIDKTAPNHALAQLGKAFALLQTYEGGYGADDQQQTDDGTDGGAVVEDMKSGSKPVTTPIAPQKAPVSKKVPVVNAPQNLDSNPTAPGRESRRIYEEVP